MKLNKILVLTAFFVNVSIFSMEPMEVSLSSSSSRDQEELKMPETPRITARNSRKLLVELFIKHRSNNNQSPEALDTLNPSEKRKLLEDIEVCEDTRKRTKINDMLEALALEESLDRESFQL